MFTLGYLLVSGLELTNFDGGWGEQAAAGGWRDQATPENEK